MWHPNCVKCEHFWMLPKMKGDSINIGSPLYREICKRYNEDGRIVEIDGEYYEVNIEKSPDGCVRFLKTKKGLEEVSSTDPDGQLLQNCSL